MIEKILGIICVFLGYMCFYAAVYFSKKPVRPYGLAYITLMIFFLILGISLVIVGVSVIL